jgi:hypothetical protein
MPVASQKKLDDYAQLHPEEIDWVITNHTNSGFAFNCLSQIRNEGSLTARQLVAIQKTIKEGSSRV